MNGPRDKRSLYRMLAQYSGIIFLLPSCVLIGYFLGYLLDEYFGTAPWLSLICVLLGAAAGFLEVFRMLHREP